MLSANVYSDSQESAIMDDDTFNILETENAKNFGGKVLSLEDIGKLDNSEQKYEVLYPLVLTQDADSSSSLGKNHAIKRFKHDDDEEEEAYYPNSYNLGLRLNFQFTFGDGGGQDWVYSASLKKVFIKMEKTLPLRFMWDPAMENSSGLFLRTELIYSLEQYRNDPVRRCHNHAALSSPVNQNVAVDKTKHVIHCVNHANSFYIEDNDHFYILTPLNAPEPGSQYVPMCFKFFCKNSCVSGMNRRATELLFTLENRRKKDIQIIARQTLAVKICSCPKRDKQKGEAEQEESVSATRERALTQTGFSSDKQVYKVELEIVGKENCLKVYRYAYEVMAGQAMKTGQTEIFKPYMDKISKKIP